MSLTTIKKQFTIANEQLTIMCVCENFLYVGISRQQTQIIVNCPLLIVN
jgi:hypothetical protein